MENKMSWEQTPPDESGNWNDNAGDGKNNATTTPRGAREGCASQGSKATRKTRVRKKKPARSQLVARSIGRATRKPRQHEHLHKIGIFARRQRKFQKKLQRQCVARKTKPDNSSTVKTSEKASSNDVNGPSDGTDGNGQRRYFLRRRYEDSYQTAPSSKDKHKSKREKQKAKLAATEGSSSQIFEGKKDEAKKRRSKQIRRKSSNQILAETADSAEWPSLLEMSKPKSSAKDAAEEIVRNKQSGTVMRMTRRRWADVAAAKRTECESVPPTDSGKTWALVASGSYKPSVDEQPGPSSKKCEAPSGNTTPQTNADGDQEGPSNEESSMIYTDALWGQGQKGMGKPNSMRFYRKLYGDGAAVKKSKHPTKSIKRLKGTRRSSRLINQKEPLNSAETKSAQVVAQAVNDGTLYQDEKATSRNTNGDHMWCIDNMPVVFTKPARSVISLREPRCLERKEKKKAVNRCNNRSVSSHSQSTSRQFIPPAPKPPKTENPEDSRSDNELSTLFSNVSFQSQTTLSTKPGPGSPNQGSNQKLAQQGRFWKQKRLEAQKKSEEEGSGQTKKISLQYRALQRKDGCRVDLKAMKEKQIKTRSSEALQDAKVCSRSEEQRHNRQRQHYVHRKTRQSEGNKGPSLRQNVTLQDWVGTSKDFLKLSNEDNAGESKAENKKRKKKKSAAEKNRGANNSVLMDAKIVLTPVASSSSIANDPVIAKSAPLLSDQTPLTPDVDIVSENNFDMGWWNTYLHGSDSTVCELVPLPEDGSAEMFFNNDIPCVLTSSSDTFRYRAV